jgi:hypothetical protein
MGKTKLKPWEVEKLTEVECAFYLDQDLERRRPPMGGRPMSGPEIQAYAAWRRSLSWREKLEIAVQDW